MIVAYLKQWWHCLVHIIGPDTHLGLICSDKDGKTVCIGCTCGKTFWRKDWQL